MGSALKHQSISEALADALDKGDLDAARRLQGRIRELELRSSPTATEWDEFPATFKREVAERVDSKGNGTRFPQDLQLKAVAYTRWRLSQGGKQATVARELGLPHPTLRRWMDTKEPTPPPVRSRTPEPAAQVPVPEHSKDMRVVEHGGLRVYLHKDEIMQVLRNAAGKA